MKNKQPTLSKEVLKAMELLRLEIFMLDDDYVKNVDPRFLVSTCRSFRIKAQNLLNALVSQFNHKVRDKEACSSDGESKSFIGTDWGKEGGDYTVETKYRKEDGKLVIEEINEIKPKESIWKPVSELPKQNSDIYSDIPCIVEDASGYHTYAIYSVNAFWDLRYGTRKMVEGYLSSASPIRYCTLTDFINQHNSLLDRVERLERIIGGKNE